MWCSCFENCIIFVYLYFGKDSVDAIHAVETARKAIRYKMYLFQYHSGVLADDI